eukprot:IDg8813t1
MKCIEKEVQKGNENAVECDALCKLTGYETKWSGEEAFRLASTYESARSMWLILGTCYFHGIGTRKSERKARAALPKSIWERSTFPESVREPQIIDSIIENDAFLENHLLLGYLRYFAELKEM